MSKGEGFVKPGEYLFVSKYRQQSVVLDAGSTIIVNGRIVTSKPVFVDFQPGPFGGQFRTSDNKLAETIRAHSVMRSRDVVEITTDDELAAWIRYTETLLETKDDRVIRKGLPKPSPIAPAEPEPVHQPAPAPKAARGPGRPGRKPRDWEPAPAV